jgi:hypothetical protein
MEEKNLHSPIRAAVRTTAAVLFLLSLASCSTLAIEAPTPIPREEPINSLALEQCIGENGQAKCAADGG